MLWGKSCHKQQEQVEFCLAVLSGASAYSEGRHSAQIWEQEVEFVFYLCWVIFVCMVVFVCRLVVEKSAPNAAMMSPWLRGIMGGEVEIFGVARLGHDIFVRLFIL